MTILSSTANTTLHLILNNSVTIWYIHSKCRSLREVRWPGIESQSTFLAFLCGFRYFTLHTLTVRFSKILTCTFEKLSSCAFAARKKHFCTQMRVSTHACKQTGFDNAKKIDMLLLMQGLLEGGFSRITMLWITLIQILSSHDLAFLWS